MAITITPEVSSILQSSNINGMVLQLPEGQLDRDLYAATDNVLKALGGKWNKKAGGHVFPFDPAPKLADAVGGGNVVSRQQKLQLFETPVALAAKLVGFLSITEEDSVLEPSAGRGRIVRALADAGPAWISAVEIDADNGDELMRDGYCDNLVVGDFLAQQPATLRCTAVAMNPPFTRNQDIKHIRHAFDCLDAGGRLAAIVSEHAFMGQEREAVEWRNWLDSLDSTVECIPAGAFKESGTTVATRMVFIRKALA